MGSNPLDGSLLRSGVRSGDAAMSLNPLELRRQFCKDLCNELVMVGDFPPIYPRWAKELALHMVRLGWTKGEPLE